MSKLLSKLSGEGNVASFPWVFLDICGDYNTAMLLNQIIFWTGKSCREDEFFYKTYEEWQQEIRLSARQVKRSVAKLQNLGFIETKICQVSGKTILHYKANEDYVEDVIRSYQQENSDTTLGNDKRSFPEVTKGHFGKRQKVISGNDKRCVPTIYTDEYVTDDNIQMTTAYYSRAEEEQPTPLSKEQIEQVITEWNALGLNKLIAIKPNTKRYKALKARIKDYSFKEVLKAIALIKESDFLQGQNDRNWIITIDWLLLPNNFIKVLEENYSDKGAKNGNRLSSDNRETKRDTTYDYLYSNL